MQITMPQDSRCYVEISRARIAANYRAVRDAVLPGAHVIGVVKANAYGHGAAEVARVLCAEGIAWLAVSSVDEGVALRDAGVDCRILVMAGIMRWERDAVREFRLTPVAHSLDDLRLLEEGGGFDVHLKIDTGMDRLGTLATASEIAAAIAAAPRVHVEGLMSHFASATDFTSHQTEEQIAVFGEMSRRWRRWALSPR
jgi:alanine racemase